jgi:hypothetical protein
MGSMTIILVYFSDIFHIKIDFRTIKQYLCGRNICFELISSFLATTRRIYTRVNLHPGCRTKFYTQQ